MNVIQKQLISRFLEMRRRVARLEMELKRTSDGRMENDLETARDEMADFGYVATLQYPQFIEEASRLIPAGETQSSPQDLLTLILMRGRLHRPPNRHRKKGETTGDWMRRQADSIAKDKADWVAAKKNRRK